MIARPTANLPKICHYIALMLVTIICMASMSRQVSAQTFVCPPPPQTLANGVVEGFVSSGGCAAQFQAMVDKLRELGLPLGRP